jgi:tetratricopeptide (TPR) repeat protein
VSLDRIEVTPFAVLAGEIIVRRRTGALTVFRDQERKEFYWVEGELVLVTSNSIHESLGAYLFRRHLVNDEHALQLTPADWTETVRVFHETDTVVRNKDALLREWVVALSLPLFSWIDGTAVFEETLPLAEERRVMMRSTSAFMLEGIRSIRNGLVLRRCLGDLQREIEPTRAPLFDIHSLPLTPAERSVVVALRQAEQLEAFIRRMPGESATVARMVILMLTLGLFVTAEPRSADAVSHPDSDPQRDLMLLAAIGADDGRSLKVVALARQLSTMNHYQLLKVPTRATRVEIMKRVGDLKRRFDPATFPPIVREHVEAVRRRLEEAGAMLQDPVRRQEYDNMLKRVDGTQLHLSMQQRMTRRAIAEKNYRKGTELAAKGDYYAAIVLLKQAVDYAPDHADAWFLLGSCQERNPQWHREATDSYQKALSINPNHVDAMLSLGDLYRSQGLTSRAESCYEDVLQIEPEHAQALKRLKRKAKAEE